MKSRFLTGAALLGAVASAIGGSAIAQRAGGRLQAIMQHLEERRSKPADDPNMSPIRGPGDYRFSVVHDRITREYLVHVPKSYHGQPAPMLIALHGGGGDADFQAEDSKYKLISKSEASRLHCRLPEWLFALPRRDPGDLECRSLLRQG